MTDQPDAVEQLARRLTGPDNPNYASMLADLRGVADASNPQSFLDEVVLVAIEALKERQSFENVTKDQEAAIKKLSAELGRQTP